MCFPNSYAKIIHKKIYEENRLLEIYAGFNSDFLTNPWALILFLKFLPFLKWLECELFLVFFWILLGDDIF